MNKHHVQMILTTIAALAATNSVSAADAGTVTFATGPVTAERQPAEALAKGDTVLVTDIVVTGDAARAQMLMIDGAKLAVRPNSRLVIEEYVYNTGEAAAGAASVSTTDDNSSVIGLVKGGFRTITGAIGREDPSDYEVRTAVGVLGIRGTDYAAQVCRGDCAWAPGVSAGTAIPDGLYLGVTDGTIVFSNEVMTIELSAGEFAYIPFDTRQPERLDAPPPVFIDDSDLQFDPDSDTATAPPRDDPAAPPTDDGSSPVGFDTKLGIRRVPKSSAPQTQGTDQDDSDSSETPKQSIQGIDTDGSPVDLTPGAAPDPQNRTITYSTGPLGAVDSIWSATLDNAPGQYQLDGNNNVTGFDNLYPARTGPDVATFDIGSASNVDTGFDSMTVLRWGRWTGGVAAITLSDGVTDASQDLGAQSLHWVSSPEWETPPVIPVTGTADYTLIGATSPTDNQGNTGVLGAANFSANFTNMSVSSFLEILISGSTWQASGTGGIGPLADPAGPPHLFNGTYNGIIIDGITTNGFGAFSGFFSQPGATSDPTFPGGVGLTYSINDGSTTTVSGAAAFGNP